MLVYDPTFAYEMAVIFRDGLKRMHEKKENIYYYITAMNENYSHPAKPDGSDQGILRECIYSKSLRVREK